LSTFISPVTGLIIDVESKINGNAHS